MSAPSADAPATGADGTSLTVALVKAGRTKIRYPADLVSDDGVRVTVRAPWAAPGVRDFGFVRFEPGDVFTEHYWRDAWFAVKEVRSGAGELKGWYCDVTRPAVLRPAPPRVRPVVRHRADGRLAHPLPGRRRRLRAP
ncbi:DUF402 domain-containing protein, partial [Streptomyces sp. NPDC002530]